MEESIADFEHPDDVMDNILIGISDVWKALRSDTLAKNEVRW